MKVTTTARMVRSTQATRLVTGSLRSGAAARVNVQRNCSATASTFTRGKAVRQTEETKRKERKKERKKEKKKTRRRRKERGGGGPLKKRKSAKRRKKKTSVCVLCFVVFSSQHLCAVPL